MITPDDFEKYGIHSIHIKSNPLQDGLSCLPILTSELDDDVWEDLYEGLLQLFEDDAFGSYNYDFMCGVLSPVEGTLVFVGSQTREVEFTKDCT